jgi:hypothetical protein
MKQSWLNGIPEDRVQEVKRDYEGSYGMRKRLIELLDVKLKASNSFSRSKDNYEKAGWPYLQADAIGYERAILDVISLISDKNVEK